MLVEAELIEPQSETDLTDSVTMLTKEGFELKHEVFLHEAPQTEPEEVTEEGFELKHEVFLHDAPTPEPEEVVEE